MDEEAAANMLDDAGEEIARLSHQRDLCREALISALSLLKCFVNPESDDIARAVVTQADNALEQSR